MTWSSTDTPELNAISERKFRTLGEMTLAMLVESGLPKSFCWWDAYVAACEITRMMPTRTRRGWMSPSNEAAVMQTARDMKEKIDAYINSHSNSSGGKPQNPVVLRRDHFGDSRA